MKSISPITKENFVKRQELIKQLGKFDNEIEARINYIAEKISSVFNIKLDTWYFPGAEEFEIGSLDKNMTKDIIDIMFEPTLLDCVIITKDKKELFFEDGFIPTRWLFEDFEDELKDGKKIYEKKLKEFKKAEKEDKEKKKEEEKKILKNIVAKLTSEEKKLLKNKFGVEE